MLRGLFRVLVLLLLLTLLSCVLAARGAETPQPPAACRAILGGAG